MSKRRFESASEVVHGRGRHAGAARAVVAALLTTAMLVGASPALAQQAKCLAGKTKCAAKKATGLLKCHTLAETPGKPPLPNSSGCVDKVVAKFDGGPDPTKGCFEKLENKPGNDCITQDDTAAAEGVIDSCVAAFVEDIDPAPLSQSKCGAGKKKCVSKYLKSLFKCHQLAQTPGKSTDPNFGGCIDKAVAKYTGGPDPTKGCFAKLENASPNDCLPPTGNSSTLRTAVDDCFDDLLAVETNTTTTSSTTLASTTSTTTMPSNGIVLKGALNPTPGRFNYNATLGLPGANAACNTHFSGTHACSYAELQNAEAAGDLVGLKDINNNTVTSFWAIDNAAAPLQQCQDDAFGGSFQNWEYGTAHTASRGSKVGLTNGTGTLGSLTTNLQCNLSGSSWVGCCQ
jgi:hypothetical protein